MVRYDGSVAPLFAGYGMYNMAEKLRRELEMEKTFQREGLLASRRRGRFRRQNGRYSRRWAAGQKLMSR